MSEDEARPDDLQPDGEAVTEETNPPEGPTFADLGLDDRILKALRELGYERPSPIQAETIPALLEGRDVVGLAQTGTGKTAAFALPILERLEPRAKHVQALVLAPTRELALQVAEAFEKYASHLRVRLLPVYGGQGYGVQLSALARGVDVVVGTPGRIMDHLDRGTLDLSELRFLVLDEADEMLNMGFAEDVEKILADTPDDKQVALFSATMPRTIRKLAETYLNDPVEVQVKGRTSTAANVKHRYMIASYQQKLDALTRVLALPGFSGVMAYALPEALWLVGHGLADVFVAYPTVDRDALARLAADEAALAAVSLAVDSVEHVEFLAAALPAGTPLRVAIDVDCSVRIGPAHLGVRRSPVRTASDAVTVVRAAQAAGFTVVGAMFYDAQVAGLPDASAAVRWLKRRTLSELPDRRAAVVAALRSVAELAFVNGGGTGSLETFGGDGSVTAGGAAPRARGGDATGPGR